MAARLFRQLLKEIQTMRHDNRPFDQMRPLHFERAYTKYAPGSVLVSYGDTKVLCTVSLEDRVPPFLRDKGEGWLTAEYALLPSSTHTRSQREVSKGKLSGRTHEIQRLIGRALRSVVDLSLLGERTLHIDADVIQADGGTRTAAISGAMVALYDAMETLSRRIVLPKSPIIEFLAAVSVGVVDGQVCCDLNYDEDSSASVDMNVVMTESGKFVELQGTAEGQPFTADQLAEMLRVGQVGVNSIIGHMKQTLGLV
jgi:ribonuclease PH